MVLVRRSFELSSSVYSLIRFFVAIFVYVQQCKMYCDWQCKDAVLNFLNVDLRSWLCVPIRVTRAYKQYTRVPHHYTDGARVYADTHSTQYKLGVLCVRARV